jgi:hypothetical protein
MMKEAFNRHGSDKSSHHGYERFYERHLRHLHDGNEPFNLLEIGYHTGSSARAWLDIYQHANVYALDIHAPSVAPPPRCTVIVGNQGDEETLVRVRNQVIGARVIIDDGSHVPEHQLKAFNAWFVNLLEPGGVYIIEDIETSYWVNGELYGYPIKCGVGHPNNIVDIFKNALHNTVNSEFAGSNDVSSPIDPIARKHIASIAFGSNCIIIHKKPSVVADRVYRFKQFTA